MPKIELQHMLNVPAVPARSAASTIMHEIAEQRGDWTEFALYLNLGALGMPDVGYVAIPVTVDELSEQTEPRHEIRFRVRSRRQPDAFPTFNGAVGIDATGASSATLWVAGTYEVPGSRVGALFNQAAGHNVAEKTLQNMMVELAEAIDARVQKREMNLARYRVMFSSGD